ncbi:MAG: flavodoxin [Duganella sp.]
MSIDNPSRRMMMTAMAALPLNDAIAAAEAAAEGAAVKARPRTLVAYLSRSGNTRVLAGVIHRAEPSDLFEIRTVRAYPDDYFETVEQARQERDRGDLPPLQGPLPAMAQYDRLYLGFPIWGETLPAPVRSFLSQLDLQGKTVVPFITHGGYGAGKSTADLAARARGALLRAPLLMEADQERRTTTAVLEWLGKPAAR